MEISKVAVIGAGLMGSGIAQVVAEAGFKTTWVDISKEQLEVGRDKIEKLLNRKIEKSEMSIEEKMKLWQDCMIRATCP